MRKEIGSSIPSSEITPESIYRERRRFMQALGAGMIAAATPAHLLAETSVEAVTPFEDATRYNNFR